MQVKLLEGHRSFKLKIIAKSCEFKIIALLHISDKHSNQLSIYHAPIRWPAPNTDKSVALLQDSQLGYQNDLLDL